MFLLLWSVVVNKHLVEASCLGFSILGYGVDIVISPHKTVIVPFTNKRNIESLGLLHFMARNLKCWGRLSIWGVILGSRLSWTQQLQKIIRKAETTFAVTRRVYGEKWRLGPTMVLWLNTRVIRPILYATLVW